MIKKPSVSVIIPNWNGKILLEDCLESLKDQVFVDFEIIVVDNGSRDGSVEYIQKYYPSIKIIELKRNYGFAKAINEGVRLSQARYVAFLNNDTKVDKNWLNCLVKTIERHPKIASVGSKVLNFYHPQIIDGVGIMINEVGQAKSIGWQEKDQGQYDKMSDIFGASAGAALYRRDVFINVGMFDEEYFMYSEEVDWAFRAQFRGYKSLFCPKAIVYHKHKASSRKLPQHLEYWQVRNMYQTIIKDFTKNLILKDWRWFKMLLVHFNTIFYLIKKGYWWPPFMADLWILLHLPDLLKKRQVIQATRKVSDSYLEGFLIKKPITFWGIKK